ncbi:hypothetical protein BJ875DRAFT_381358 [Amylocarpus encephaloides]|uniref:Ribosomal RNA methyltransferase FtsJ domain-containing protein n=1 Tax=Amylocarpus encephaloides TaxID=45428 RepID=A0A9P8C3K4_9HELO|nr:hypothetical protein BJ875DRAFT_381358 [Amylocarpus encephaloides]
MEKKSLEGATMKPMMVTEEELVAILEKHTIGGDPRERNLDRSSRLVKAYCLKNEPEFRRVTEFRERGWVQNKEKGDAFFKAQREKADHTDEVSEKKFYNMMQRIAEEMHGLTGVLNPPQQDVELKTLDICMAPGGYTAAIIKRHPRAKAFGITLSRKQGGHPLHFPFASVDVFKPVKMHGTRSSFYMIAKDVQPQAEGAVSAVKESKDAWRKATFGGEDGTGEKVDPPISYTIELLENYGERLIEMGRGVWKIQADALSGTDYAGDGSAGSCFGGLMMNSPPKTPKTPAFRRSSQVKPEVEHHRNVSPSNNALSPLQQ